ncbi:YIP1 family protein [uncultured Methanolobus sp.]|uniref:YIP1 family protein n=1 Tax=uncultured Methanolobus sp. TaxID=218300 RepID=UPI002AABB107|nr:YIP1 family protein [uncultured Methanolobus sp.]
MLEVLTNPESFFGKKINEEIEWKTPIAIIALVIVAKIMSSFILTVGAVGLFDGLGENGVGEFVSIMLIVRFVIGIFVAIIGTLLWWLLYSALFHVVSSIFNGEGDFLRVMEFVSYGFIPKIFRSILEVLYGNELLATVGNAINNPGLSGEAIIADPTLKIAPVIIIIFTLWSGYIWTYGLAHSRNISVKNAAIPVAIPVVLSILYTLFQFRQILMW